MWARRGHGDEAGNQHSTHWAATTMITHDDNAITWRDVARPVCKAGDGTVRWSLFVLADDLERLSRTA
ncbi:hypothetical protein [Mycobacterium camsae]|uniref:hypothetical protein n=1 Tax=Mycobacterium gordonae TaxID=1778 RepID=UPI00197E67B4|nr:hypothetical protein [Mycobacterium gordonae]